MQRLIGSRCGETYLLEWRDIDRESECVTFRSEITKSRKSRRVPLPSRLLSELEDRRGEPEDEVFPLVSKNQTRRYKVFKRALRSIGLEKGSLHDLRRSRAMEIYRKTGDIRIASRWLGDSEIIAMKHYIEDVSIDELRRAVIYGEKLQ